MNEKDISDESAADANMQTDTENLLNELEDAEPKHEDDIAMEAVNDMSDADRKAFENTPEGIRLRRSCAARRLSQLRGITITPEDIIRDEFVFMTPAQRAEVQAAYGALDFAEQILPKMLEVFQGRCIRIARDALQEQWHRIAVVFGYPTASDADDAGAMLKLDPVFGIGSVMMITPEKVAEYTAAQAERVASRATMMDVNGKLDIEQLIKMVRTGAVSIHPLGSTLSGEPKIAIKTGGCDGECCEKNCKSE